MYQDFPIYEHLKEEPYYYGKLISQHTLYIFSNFFSLRVPNLAKETTKFIFSDRYKFEHQFATFGVLE